MKEHTHKNYTGEEASLAGTPDERQLSLINRYARRELKASEVFAFSVILCDNEIDRDGERFPEEALSKLGELFVGKTGVFDHNPKAQNQSARIFETQLTHEARQNSLGEPYCCLKAWAYMLRSDKNADLILEIDGGIIKEVSVGCAVAKALCSVCGKDQKRAACEHKKGRSYGDALCHHLLVEPTDAYEWSFVAVPAQRNAGVTKRCGHAGGEILLEKWVEADDNSDLNEAQVQSLRRQCKALRDLAEAGKTHTEALRGEVVRLALLAQPELDSKAMAQVAKRMDAAELEAFRKAFAGSVAQRYPVTLQLGSPAKKAEANTDAAFRI